MPCLISQDFGIIGMRNLELTAEYKFPRMARKHILIKLFRYRLAVRKLLGRIVAVKLPSLIKLEFPISRNFEAASEKYSQHNWAYIENIMDLSIHQQLLTSWPKTIHFIPNRNIYKSYDTGFGWKPTQSIEDVEHLSKYPIIEAFYTHLDSEDFCKRVTDICGDGIERSRWATSLTHANWGSTVIPHIDTIPQDPYAGFVNLVFLIYGNTGPRSGGLSMYSGPHWSNLIFEPSNLNNTLMMYDTQEDLWHGFPPMRFGTRRYTINCQFSSKQWMAENLTAWLRGELPVKRFEK